MDDSFLCAGGEEGQDTCKGDGGGPLVCPRYTNVNSEQQQYVQTGIVAWGIGCGANLPGAYANVSDSLCFVDWATKCVHGQDADFYGYSGCQRWGKRQYCRAKYALEDLQYDQNKGRGQKVREGAQLRRQLENYEKAVQSCQTGADYGVAIDCEYYDYDGDSTDLSGHARDSAKQNAGLKTADQEEEVVGDEEEEEVNDNADDSAIADTGPRINFGDRK